MYRTIQGSKREGKENRDKLKKNRQTERKNIDIDR
jgi:hypothetical protein